MLFELWLRGGLCAVAERRKYGLDDDDDGCSCVRVVILYGGQVLL